MQPQLPTILAVSINAWRDEGNIHTQIDIFSNWQADRMAQIYAKADLPNTTVCHKFFQVAENSVLHSIYRPGAKVGKEVFNTTEFSDKDKVAMAEEHARYARARKKHSWLMSCCRELVWLLGHWKSKELDRFIDEVNPDVLFIPIYPTIYMGWLQRYVLKRTGKPAVCYLADDNYTYKSCGRNPLAYVHRFFLRREVSRLVKACDKMFVIVDKQKEEYDRIFGVDSRILTKGIDYSKLQREEIPVHFPLRMVYTGKLIIGRDKSLAAISKALKEINRNGEKITLDVYSPDIVDEETMKLLNSNGVSFKGSVPLQQVAAIQAQADIVVFVESLEKEFRQAARLSFSTKLTDYFKSGKCVFAIGDAEIAPIDYLRRNDAAVIASEYDEILPQLQKMVEHPEMVNEYGRKGFECGKRNHDVEVIKKTLRDTFCEVYENHRRRS